MARERCCVRSAAEVLMGGRWILAPETHVGPAGAVWLGVSGTGRGTEVEEGDRAPLAGPRRIQTHRETGGTQRHPVAAPFLCRCDHGVLGTHCRQAQDLSPLRMALSDSLLPGCVPVSRVPFSDGDSDTPPPLRPALLGADLRASGCLGRPQRLAGNASGEEAGARPWDVGAGGWTQRTRARVSCLHPLSTVRPTVGKTLSPESSRKSSV